jgi:hypothetical protein
MSNTAHILGEVHTDAQETNMRSTSIKDGIAKMDKEKVYLTAIETQMEKLKDLIKENNKKQEEIIALRDGVRISSPLPQSQI